MDRIPDDVARLPLQDLDGAPRPLGSLWANRPAVIAFLRHFG
jgi:hypothetical protein